MAQIALPGSRVDAADFTCETGLTSLNGIAMCHAEAPCVVRNDLTSMPNCPASTYICTAFVGSSALHNQMCTSSWTNACMTAYPQSV